MKGRGRGTGSREELGVALKQPGLKAGGLTDLKEPPCLRVLLKLVRVLLHLKLQLFMKHSELLPASELLRIRNVCNSATLQEQAEKHERESHERSKLKARIEQWPNTIFTLRKQRDEHRFQRFAAEEQKRRELEREHKEYEDNRKRVQLQSARDKLFASSLEGRHLRTELLKSQALSVLDSQLKFKAGMKKREVQERKMLSEQQKQDEEMLARVQRKCSDLKETKRVLAVQVEQTKLAHRLEWRQKEMEQAKLKCKEEEADQQQREKERLKKVKSLRLLADQLQMVEDCKARLATERQASHQEDEKAREYESRKNMVLKIRQDRKQVILREQDRQREKLLAKLASQFREKEDRLDSFISRQGSSIYKSLIERDAISSQRLQKSQEKVNQFNRSQVEEYRRRRQAEKEAIGPARQLRDQVTAQLLAKQKDQQQLRLFKQKQRQLVLQEQIREKEEKRIKQAELKDREDRAMQKELQKRKLQDERRKDQFLGGLAQRGVNALPYKRRIERAYQNQNL